VQEAVKNVKDYLQKREPGRPWLKKAPAPLAKDYRPEIDILSELVTDNGTYYQSQIGVLRWMVSSPRCRCYHHMILRVPEKDTWKQCIETLHTLTRSLILE
jgi:hypothetical protein